MQKTQDTVRAAMPQSVDVATATVAVCRVGGVETETVSREKDVRNACSK